MTIKTGDCESVNDHLKVVELCASRTDNHKAFVFFIKIYKNMFGTNLVKNALVKLLGLLQDV